MRAIFETGFYYLYLIFIIGLGIYLLIKKEEYIFAIVCIILGLVGFNVIKQEVPHSNLN